MRFDRGTFMSMSVLQPLVRKADRRAVKADQTNAPPGSAVSPRSVSPHLFKFLSPVLLGLALLAVWTYITTSGAVPTYQLPTPATVWGALVDGLTSSLFLTSTLVTLQESLGGFLLAALFALPLGYALTKWRPVALTLQPYLVTGQAIPAIVWIPFLVLWLGYGMGPIVVVCLLVVLFNMIMTTALGFQTIEPSLPESARVEGAGFWPMLINIELPLALPALMTALRTGLTLSVTGALVGEIVSGSDQGLGALVMIAKNQYNLPLMFATVVILALLAGVLYGLGRVLTHWTETRFG
jgi:NitT/TauT family transport system permease protein